MIAQLIVALTIGWLLGMGTALYLGASYTRQQRARRKVASANAGNPLADPEVLAALEREIARVKGAAARGEPAHE
jgi:hypothetical protein